MDTEEPEGEGQAQGGGGSGPAALPPPQPEAVTAKGMSASPFVMLCTVLYRIALHCTALYRRQGAGPFN